MLSHQERKQMISQIEQLPAKLRETVSTLNDRQLDTPYRENGWTVRQVVHHLADSHVNGYVRMKLLLTEENTTLKTYQQDDWANLIDSVKLSIISSLIILDGLHSRWVYCLRNVPADIWAKPANHPETGTVTLDDLLKIYSYHGINHLMQINDLKSSMGWQ